jgi:hypothetical protein
VRNISSVSDNAITAAKLNSAAITGQTAETSVDDDDLVLIYDDSATALRKMTKSNFISGLATVNGITEADTWRITSNFTATTGGYQAITSNWERDDSNLNINMGTGMTESSGIFTFPSTGVYLIQYHLEWNHNAAAAYLTHAIDVTINNSSYVATSQGNSFMASLGARGYTSQDCQRILDITDTTNQKVRFVYDASDACTIGGWTNGNSTSVLFIRLGDT